MTRTRRKILLCLAIFTASLFLGACAYLQHPKFGAYPEGERLEKIRRSPRYVDGECRNLIDTQRFSGLSPSTAVNPEVGSHRCDSVN